MCTFAYIAMVVVLVGLLWGVHHGYSERIASLELKLLSSDHKIQCLDLDLAIAKGRLEQAYRENEELVLHRSHVPNDCCITDACANCGFGEAYNIRTGIHKRETTYYCKKYLCNGFVKKDEVES